MAATMPIRPNAPKGRRSAIRVLMTSSAWHPAWVSEEVNVGKFGAGLSKAPAAHTASALALMVQSRLFASSSLISASSFTSVFFLHTKVQRGLIQLYWILVATEDPSWDANTTRAMSALPLCR